MYCSKLQFTLVKFISVNLSIVRFSKVQCIVINYCVVQLGVLHLITINSTIAKLQQFCVLKSVVGNYNAKTCNALH